MNVTETELPGVFVIEPLTFHDSRGFFCETFHAERYGQQGINETFVQDNFSSSLKNVVRGLHYQKEHAQGKLVFVTYGQVIDVVVDIRIGSPTFAKAITIELNDQNNKQIFIPPGLAHGFCVLSDRADVLYKCTDLYYPASEFGVRWDDPDLQIEWPNIEKPILSTKDSLHPFLKDIPENHLPRFKQ